MVDEAPPPAWPRVIVAAVFRAGSGRTSPSGRLHVTPPAIWRPLPQSVTRPAKPHTLGNNAPCEPTRWRQVHGVMLRDTREPHPQKPSYPVPGATPAPVRSSPATRPSVRPRSSSMQRGNWHIPTSSWVWPKGRVSWRVRLVECCLDAPHDPSVTSPAALRLTLASEPRGLAAAPSLPLTHSPRLLRCLGPGKH